MWGTEQEVEDTGLDSCTNVTEGPIYTYRGIQTAKAGPDSCDSLSKEFWGIQYGINQMKEVRFPWRSDY